MYQFTRELIVNTNRKGKLKEGKPDERGTTPYSVFGKGKFAVNKEKDLLLIDNFVNIKKDQLDGEVTYANPIEATNEVCTLESTLFDVTGLKAGDLVRLTITLGHEGSVISTFNDYYPDHSKHVYVEAVCTGNTVPVDVLVKNFEDGNTKVEGLNYVELSEDGGNLVITALDEFTRVKHVKLVKVGAADGNVAILTGYGDYIAIYDADRKKMEEGGVITTPGEVGRGTTNILIRNNRVQTIPNFDPFGLNLDERPVPGALYTQFCIQLVTDRQNLGHQVVGSLDKSLTTMIIFAEGTKEEENSAAKELYLALTDQTKGLGVTVDEYPKPKAATI